MGMEYLPKSLQMKAEHLWNDIFLYHGADISNKLNNSTNGDAIFASEHAGKMFVYKIDKDFNVVVLKGTNGDTETKNKLLEKYGLVRGETLGVGKFEQGVEDKGRQNNNSTTILSDGGTSRVDSRDESEPTNGFDRVGRQNVPLTSESNRGKRSIGEQVGLASNQIESAKHAEWEKARFSIGQRNTPNERIVEITNELVRTLNSKGLNNKFFQLIEEIQNGYILLNKVFTSLNEARVASGKKALSVGQHLETIAAGTRGRAASMLAMFDSYGHKKAYKHRKQDGVQRFWYGSGQLEREWNYKNGQRDGVHKEWHSNGQLKNIAVR